VVAAGADAAAGDTAANSARWLVHLDDGPPLAAEHVIVATGYNHTPVTPDWPGLDGFTGDLVLARDYRNGRPYAGRDVLVVGTGNTGTEIATDLAEHGATRVWLAVRTPPHIIRRDMLGWPAQGTGILVRRLPPRLVDRVAHGLAAVQEPDLSAYGMPRADPGLYSRVLVGRVPVQDVGIVDAIRTRRVEPVAAVEACSTGEACPWCTVPTSPRALSGLWFTGFTNPISGMLRELRIDAERIAAAIAR
jgi:putative flavoprotein involved in K+ transport